jgi:predicted ATPase
MENKPSACENKCYCTKERHETGLVVVTGGPGAGKTAVLEMARKHLCRHVAILPESASLIFKGGFWRMDSEVAKAAAQRAIFHVQRELEGMILEDPRWALGLCDRGTLDGLAYWPSIEEQFWRQVGSGRATELSRYRAVIHLRTPSAENGYNYQNELRLETPEQAKKIDDHIAEIWSSHPRYVQIPSTPNFLVKAQQALAALENELPSCCRPPS